jgi:putative transcriptional regulator
VSTKLSPGLLLSTPSLGCPVFERSLVLLVEHGEEGAFGFMINRPAGIDMPDILEALGLAAPADLRLRVPVMLGGPVTPETGWVVFDPRGLSFDYSEATQITDHLFVSTSVDTLASLTQESGLESIVMILGYAGWGPGQLDQEILEGSWIPLDLDPSLVFGVPADERWNAAYMTLGVTPGQMARPIVAEA